MKLKKKASMEKLLTLNIKDSECDLYFPETVDDIIRFTMDNKDFYVLAGGSNIVAGKVNKPVLYMADMIGTSNTEDISENAVKVFMPAGVSISKLLDYSIKNGLSGVEFMAGIPGTVGGALYGNSAPSENSWDDVTGALYIIFEGTVSMNIPRYSYRKLENAPAKSFVIYGADLILVKDTQENVRQRVMYYLSKRLKINEPSAGSFFKNPENESAGYLLDKAGMKGFRVNDAALSEDHANIVLNKGAALYRDFCDLKNIAKNKVKETFNIDLEPEVSFWDE